VTDDNKPENPTPQPENQDTAIPPIFSEPDSPSSSDTADPDVQEPENSLPEVQLSDLSETARQAATRAGWDKLMPVQAKAIPYLLAGRDLMIQSHTGSGKTGAFILPILSQIDPSKPVCQAMVLVPTRELAFQVEKEAALLAGPDGPRTVAVYGGVGYNTQLDAFRQGAHLVVGTPGRILDHLLRRSLRLDHLRYLVLDEADRMLSMGFYPDMKAVQKYLPKSGFSSFMFSATFPVNVLRLAEHFLRNPETLSLSRDHVHALDTEHVFYITPLMEKDRALVRIIESENPPSAFIFCNTRATVHYVATVLQRFGYDADELSSDLGQGAREDVLNRVRKGTLRFLVATDVAARGIDIPELSHVIQYEPPDDVEAYIHRAGRTGRAGAAGIAISLVGGAERMALERIGKRFSIELKERPLPSQEDVETLVGERLTAHLEARLRDMDRLEAERAQRFLPLAQSWGKTKTRRLLMAILLDECYHQMLHQRTDVEAVAGRKTSSRGKQSPTTSNGERKEREEGETSRSRKRRPRKRRSS
jgi:ATP-dependent RNA helicase DeaD